MGASGTVRFITNGPTFDSTKTITFTGGTLDLNSLTFTGGPWTISGATAKVLAFGTNGTIINAGTGASAWNTIVTSMTTTGTGTINMTGATAKTFVGASRPYNITLNQGGAGALTISGSNTFYDITATTLPSTITFTAGTTQKIGRAHV